MASVLDYPAMEKTDKHGRTHKYGKIFLSPEDVKKIQENYAIEDLIDLDDWFITKRIYVNGVCIPWASEKRLSKEFELAPDELYHITSLESQHHRNGESNNTRQNIDENITIFTAPLSERSIITASDVVQKTYIFDTFISSYSQREEIVRAPDSTVQYEKIDWEYPQNVLVPSDRWLAKEFNIEGEYASKLL